ncbi:MAG: L,D-transpeptidase family protein, partial [Rhizobiaceae bacterium]|nr:L,D-transpeptidase family protein [Rhizobiaceae bacterium]
MTNEKRPYLWDKIDAPLSRSGRKRAQEMRALMPPSLLRRAVFCLVLSLPAVAAQEQDLSGESLPKGPEGQLHRALELMEDGQLDAAILEVDQLVSKYPNFRMAHMLQGDLLLARAGRPTLAGPTGADPDPFAELRAEFRARDRNRRDPPPAGFVPRNLMRLTPGQHVIVVDASRSRVYLYNEQGGAPLAVRNYYSAIGKLGTAKEREGDKKTPIGIYFVSSHIPGARLPDLYGWGAFPISYPNEWDRRLGRTGSGIWLHGVPSDNYARSPFSTDGCVALANGEIADLAPRVQPGITPVVMAERIEWIAHETLREESDDFQQTLEQWRRDWESRNTENYLDHYSRNFRSDGMDLATWKARKRRVNADKSWIKVELGSLSILRDSGTEPL